MVLKHRLLGYRLLLTVREQTALTTADSGGKLNEYAEIVD